MQDNVSSPGSAPIFPIRINWGKPQFCLCPICGKPAHAYCVRLPNGERQAAIHCQNFDCTSYCSTERFKQVFADDLLKESEKISTAPRRGVLDAETAEATGLPLAGKNRGQSLSRQAQQSNAGVRSVCGARREHTVRARQTRVS